MSRNCSIILHSHVPWVRHPEVSRSLEEDWFHSVIVETHLPLLEMMFRLRNQGIPFRIAMDLSPTLLAMMGDKLLRRRTIDYMDRTIALCQDEVERGDITGMKDLAAQYLARFQKLRSLYMDTWQCDLLRAYAALRDSGHIELMASAATHGLLPLLMRVPESVQAQIRAGIRQYVQSFGRMPRGFWLPECAFAPALGLVLKREGIDWTIVDEHALTTSPQANPNFPFVPGITEANLCVFGRDQASTQEVWDADEGYAGDERYRNFFRDVGLEAPIEYLREYLGEDEQRRFTGIKYYRSGGDGEEQNPVYDTAMAARAVEEHSVRFVVNRGAQLAALEASGIEDPITICAFDADLFGRWWFEGIDFLEQIFRRFAARPDITLITPGAYLAATKDKPLSPSAPVSSSWGEGGYFETWTNDQNDWVLAEIYERAEQLARFVKLFQENRSNLASESVQHCERAIQLMTRELLFAQSSDWSFLILNEASYEYAENRVREHLARFDRIRALSTLDGVQDDLLQEEMDPETAFSDLPWNLYEPYA